MSENSLKVVTTGCHRNSFRVVSGETFRMTAGYDIGGDGGQRSGLAFPAAGVLTLVAW